MIRFLFTTSQLSASYKSDTHEVVWEGDVVKVFNLPEEGKGGILLPRSAQKKLVAIYNKDHVVAILFEDTKGV